MQALGMMLETTARWFPDKPFLIFEGETITYAEFNCRAARLAGLLSSLGAGKGTPVGLYLPSTPEVAVAYHACPEGLCHRAADQRQLQVRRGRGAGPEDPHAGADLPGGKCAGSGRRAALAARPVACARGRWRGAGLGDRAAR